MLLLNEMFPGKSLPLTFIRQKMSRRGTDEPILEVLIEELLKDQKEEEERMVQSQEHDGESAGQDLRYLGNQESQLELLKDQKEKIEKKAVMQSQEQDGKSGFQNSMYFGNQDQIDLTLEISTRQNKPQSENLDSDPFPLDDNEDDFLMEECQCQDEIFIDEFV